jgi:hypothetical protein
MRDQRAQNLEGAGAQRDRASFLGQKTPFRLEPERTEVNYTSITLVHTAAILSRVVA